MTEFVVAWQGGSETIIEVGSPDDVDVACAELFGAETVFIDMVYRNATDEESRCPAIYPMDHSASWWEGYACIQCGTP